MPPWGRLLSGLLLLLCVAALSVWGRFRGTLPEPQRRAAATPATARPNATAANAAAARPNATGASPPQRPPRAHGPTAPPTSTEVRPDTPPCCLSLADYLFAELQQTQLDWEALSGHKKLTTTYRYSLFGRRDFVTSEPFQTAGSGTVFRENYVAADVFAVRRLGLRQGDVVIDCGAHLGLFAAHVAALYPQAHVYSLEPLPRNFKYLTMNLRRAKLLDRVTPINLALVDADGWRVVHYAPYMTQHSLPFSARNGRVLPFVAPAVTLRTLLAALGVRRVRVLKVDCMGCEYLMMDAVDPATVDLLVGRVNAFPPSVVSLEKATSVHQRMCSWNQRHGWRFGEGVGGCAKPPAPAPTLLGPGAADRRHAEDVLRSKATLAQVFRRCPSRRSLPALNYGWTEDHLHLLSVMHQRDFELQMGDLAHVHEFPLAAGQGARPIQLAEDVFRWAAATTWQRTLPLLAGLQGAGLRQGSVAAVVGGHEGLLAIALAKQFPALTVVALEPVPRHFRYLKWNVRRNAAHGQVVALNLAVVPHATWRAECSNTSWPRTNVTYNPFSLQVLPPFPSQLLSLPALAISLPALPATLSVRPPDILQVDCGGCEWAIAEDVANAGVPRVAGRLHPPPPTLSAAAAATAQQHLCSVRHGFECCPGRPCTLPRRIPPEVLRAEGELHRLLRETHPPGGRLHPLLPGLLPAYDLPPVWPGRPTVEVLVRSYWMEEGTLRGFLLPSLATFWPWPQHRAVIVLDFESDKDHVVAATLRRTVPYPRVVFERLPPNPPAVFSQRLAGVTLGYHQQQYSNFFADLYSTAAVIALMDSDSILATPQPPEAWFDPEGRPIAIGVLHWSRREPQGRWAQGTAVALGRPQYADFMVNFPIRIPRAVFPAVRQFLEAHHKIPFDQVFYKISDCCEKGYSQFNIILNYAWYFMRDSIAWRFHNLREPTPPSIRTGCHMTQQLGFQDARRTMHEGVCFARNFSYASCSQYRNLRKPHQLALFTWKNMEPWGNVSTRNAAQRRHQRAVAQLAPAVALGPGADYFRFLTT